MATDPAPQPTPHPASEATPASTHPLDSRLATRFNLIGTEVSAITFDETVDALLDAPTAGRPSDQRALSVHFCPVHTIVEARRDPTLAALLNAADVVAPDGVPVAWIGRLRGQRITRVCGPDLMLAVLDRGRARNASHYLYGGAEGTPERLAERLTELLPGLRIAGLESPPFRPLTPAEDQAAVDRINASGADFVWIGLGSPKQDRWVADHRQRLDAAAVLAVGAAFDFHAGSVARAPRWMQRSGLEWLYRFGSEPRRLWRRYTVSNARFAAYLALDALRTLPFPRRRPSR